VSVATTSRALALSAFAFVVLTPTITYACPVCFDANEANRTAFVATTIFLSTLPLAMVGGIALWVRRLSDRG
jgi:NADH:ubiquinone oxidoreductase subunit 3 (subunit A)